MLDLGFQQDVSAIMTKLPRQRRTGLFSATLNAEVSRLVKAGLRNPVHVKVSTEKKRKREEEPAPAPVADDEDETEKRIREWREKTGKAEAKKPRAEKPPAEEEDS